MEGLDFTVCYIQKRRGWRRDEGWDIGEKARIEYSSILCLFIPPAPSIK